MKQSREKINLWRELDFLALHLLPLLAFFTGTTWFDWLLALSLYLVRMFFVTAGYHRYFSHRSFKTSRLMQFFLAWGAQTSFQKGVLWWAAHHRDHHSHSDTPQDPHSAKIYGFWYAHIGWIMGPDFKDTKIENIRDFARFPELRWLNRFHALPALSLALGVYFLGNYFNGSGWTDWTAGLSTLLIGFLFSTIVLYHGTFTINSLMHRLGRKRYPTQDESRNSFWLALLTLGEGWHNNHHYYQSSARQGFFWWEIDLTYYIIKIMAWLRLVWDIRPVPHEVKQGLT